MKFIIATISSGKNLELSEDELNEIIEEYTDELNEIIEEYTDEIQKAKDAIIDILEDLLDERV